MCLEEPKEDPKMNYSGQKMQSGHRENLEMCEIC